MISLVCLNRLAADCLQSTKTIILYGVGLYTGVDLSQILGGKNLGKIYFQAKNLEKVPFYSLKNV